MLDRCVQTITVILQLCWLENYCGLLWVMLIMGINFVSNNLITIISTIVIVICLFTTFIETLWPMSWCESFTRTKPNTSMSHTIYTKQDTIWCKQHWNFSSIIYLKFRSSFLNQSSGTWAMAFEYIPYTVPAWPVRRKISHFVRSRNMW